MKSQRWKLSLRKHHRPLLLLLTPITSIWKSSPSLKMFNLTLRKMTKIVHNSHLFNAPAMSNSSKTTGMEMMKNQKKKKRKSTNLLKKTNKI